MQPTPRDIDSTPEPPRAPDTPPPHATEDRLSSGSGDGKDGGSGRGDATWYQDSLFWGIFLAALAADQITKAIVTSNLDRGESWPDGGFVQATYARNTGTAFGLFRDQGFTLTIISLVAVAGMIYFYRGTALRTWPLRLSIGIMLGGAIGNLTDRIRLGFVVDFIDIGAWPIFNLADSFITTGIAILVVTTVIFPDRLATSRAGPVDEHPADKQTGGAQTGGEPPGEGRFADDDAPAAPPDDDPETYPENAPGKKT